MKRFSEQLKKKSLSIRLSSAEKRDVRARLVTFMEYHPLPANLNTKKIPTLEQAPYRLVSIPARFLKLGFGTMAALLLIVLPTLAERAIPGDILYPVKIQVNEEVRGTLNWTASDKVAWETERLERRVNEARTLALEGRLTPEVEADVLAAVKAHTNAAESEIQTIKTTDAEAASLAQMTFASKLDVQSVILRSMQTNSVVATARINPASSTEATSPTSALAGAIERGREEAFDKSERSPVSFERMMAQLEIETTRAHELLRSLTKTATLNERSEVERRLADIERAIDDSAKLYGEEPKRALEELKSSWLDTQKLITFMSNLNVRSLVSVESLVPMVPTFEERQAKVKSTYTDIEQQVKRVERGLSRLENQEIAEKIKLTLPEIKDLLVTASTTNPETIASAETAVASAQELSATLLSLANFPTPTEEELKAEAEAETKLEIGDKGTSTASTTISTSTKSTTTKPSEPKLPLGL